MDTAEQSLSEVIVGDRYAIDLNVPMSQFDTVGASAFAVRDILDPRRKFYALVQRPGSLRRNQTVRKLMGRTIPGLLCPRAEGVVAVPGDGERLVTIIDYPAGGAVADDVNGFHAISERMIREQIAPQIFATLASLDSIGVSHRSISLQNLYYRDRQKKEIVLGDCFSAPPAYHQPWGYEPIERVLAHPAARGEGDAACDMYAFGVLLMSLFLGRDVGGRDVGGRDVGASGGADVAAHVDARIRLGSYWALGGSNELTGAMGDLLRGLMDDNASKRWMLDDVKRWIDGIVSRKTVPDQGWLLGRPTMFCDRGMKDRRQLAVAMMDAPKESVAFMRHDRFRQWVENALADVTSSEWLDRALDQRLLNNTADLTAKEEYMAVARLVAVFYPEAPLVYGSVVFYPDGIDYYLAMLMLDGDVERLELLSDFLDRNRIDAIVEILSGRVSSMRGQSSRIASLTKHGAAPGLGQGLERSLYELNRSMPCLSPKLRGLYVTDLERLMAALEAAAARGDMGGGAFDHHIAAFMARHLSALDPMFARLSSLADQPENYAIEVVRILGTVQQNAYPRPLKQLAHALLPTLKRPVEKLKSATRRKQAMALLTALAEAGNLMRIANELNLRTLQQRDEREFQGARRLVSQLSVMQRRLEQPLDVSHGQVRLLGYKLAAYFGYIAVIVVAASLFLQGQG